MSASLAANPGVSPGRLWDVLAPVVAGRPVVRLWARGRYARSRPLGALPRVPAAVHLYDAAGLARCVVLDLDIKPHGPAQVLDDVDTAAGLLERCGLRYFVDGSPTGGRHVYVPLQEPLPRPRVMRVLGGLKALLPSLDTSAMANDRTGAIRPPGARHPRGGHQFLLSDWHATLAAATKPNPATAWARLDTEVTTTAPRPEPTGTASLVTAGSWVARLGLLGLTTRLDQLARTGDGADAYRSRSEAAQAVLTGAAAAGWRMADVAARLDDGTWAALAGYYQDKYRSWRSALARDWRKATDHVTRNPHARRCTTSQHPHTPRTGGHHSTGDIAGCRQVREWISAVHLVEQRRYGQDPSGITARMLLRALGEAAHCVHKVFLAHGCRSLAVATNRDHSTVSRALRRLAAEPDPLIVQIGEAHGVHADEWLLRIPDEVAESARRRPWPRGKIRAVRPVFRELGAPAALVYEALEAARDPESGRHQSVSVFGLVEMTGLGRRTVHEALRALGTHGLTERRRGGWVLGPADPALVAEQLGCDEDMRAQIERYRRDRKLWREWLGLPPNRTTERSPPPPLPLTAPTSRAPPPDPRPPGWHEQTGPPEPERLTPIQLVALVLGGVPIDHSTGWSRIL